MPFDFTGLTYTSTDGKMTFGFDDLHLNTLVRAFGKAADHVFGNEAISKGSTAKAKAGVEGDAYTEAFTEAMYDAIIAEARDKYLADMKAGVWGEKGNRAPRQPGATRLEQIFTMIAAEDTRKAIAKAGLTAVDGKKNAWINPSDNTERPLGDWVEAFLSHPELGADRKASVQIRADAKMAAEVADAAQRKADKEREAGVVKGAGLSI